MTTVTDPLSTTGALSGSWTATAGAPSYAISNGGVGAPTDPGASAYPVYRNDVTCTGDMEAEVEIHVLNGPVGYSVGPAVNVDPANDSSYFTIIPDTYDSIFIDKRDSGGTLSLQLSITGLSIVATDKVKLRSQVSGLNRVLTAFLNGAQVGTVTDSTSALVGQRVGIAGYVIDATNRVSAFTGGDYSPGGGDTLMGQASL